ncbi:2881_t:CDS:2 [Entrophospora sp. SA101]|nr:8118_t:CDS:2 [Entrophospora sp. SA101]CAJ0766581.1 2881_t:CDS:2 [Entrophospora sp. SA101]
MVPTTINPIAVSQNTTVIVHPLVLLSVVDHYNRVAKNTKKRVVGVLLGQNNGKTVNVANSFAVPFEEDERDLSVWFLDHNYVEAMNDMFKKVNAREKMIGWYHSGPKLRASDLEINELFKRYTPNPVLVIVDVKPKDIGIPTDAYFAIEEIKDDGTATTKTFMHVPSQIEAEEAEEIGVEHLLRDIKDNAVGTLSTRVTDQLNSLKGLQSRLEEIRDYLQKVVNGTLPINHQILYNLQDIFNLLPNLNITEMVKAFSVKTNDQLLVIYLSSLVRAVIALHNLINNKIENLKDSRKYMNNNESSKYNNNWNSIKDSRIISSAEDNEKLARRTQRFNNSKKEPKGMSDVDMFLIAIVCTWNVSKFIENNSTKTTLDPSNNDNTITETTNNNMKRMKAYDFFIDREPPVCFSELYSINEDQLCEELEERLNIGKI